MKKQKVKKVIKEGYAEIAKGKGSCCKPEKSCCDSKDYVKTTSKNIGYSDKEMNAVPEGANLGLGCGNPIALASLAPGETVLDLGSGAGFDCFLAANKVEEKGRVIGIDMTEEMIEKAKENATKGNYKNVEFRLGEIENIPAEDNSVDVVISNCVINLSPEKQKVFDESYRILKPGGRIFVSDIVLLKELPDFIKESVAAIVGCLSGAVLKHEYIKFIENAGFKDVKILDEQCFPITCMENDPTAKALIEKMNISQDQLKEYDKMVLSIKVSARKE